MKKKDKVIILLILGILCCAMTWFVKCGTYREGLFISSGIYRAGLFDYLLIVYYSLFHRASDVFFLFTLGGLYGVLSQTKGYRKLVSSTVKLIKNREIPALLITTFVIGLFISFTNEVMASLIVVPFIITVFLKRGKDRLTAFSAAFGGVFIGTFGLTLGTYGVGELLSAVGLTVKDGIGFKIAMFIITYALYNLFAILHMKQQEDVVNHTKYDMFTTQKLDETEKGAKKQKIWPTIVVLAIMVVVGFVAYINWYESFDVTTFDELVTKMGDWTIKDVPFVKNFLGSFEAFGRWSDLLPLSFVLIVTSILAAIVNKVSISDFIDNFGDGAKKMCKVAVIYVLAMSIFVITYYYPWAGTLINNVFGSGKFSLFSLLLVGCIAGIFFVDPEYIGFVLGTYVLATFSEKILATTLLLHFGYCMSMILAPTSCMLMIGLTYLDIPYKNWLKYIWKFALCILVVSILLVAIMVYA